MSAVDNGCSNELCAGAAESPALRLPIDRRVADRASDATLTLLAMVGCKDLIEGVGVPMPKDMFVMAVL